MRQRTALYAIVLVSLLLFAYSQYARTTRAPSLSTSDFPSAFDEAREKHLRNIRFDPAAGARDIKAPEHLPSGGLTFDTSLDKYRERLETFAKKYLGRSPGKESLLLQVDSILRKSAQEVSLPTTLWSTSPEATTSDSFDLWAELLKRPPKAFSAGADWTVKVLDDAAVVQIMTRWSGEEELAVGPLAELWKKLSFGVLRADLFRYMSMLWEGGIYADTDTGPIAHPYLWGVGAKSILPQRQQELLKAMGDSYQPPYVPRQLVPSIATSEINVVIGIEWDSALAGSWWQILRWDPGRSRRVRQDGYPRRLQFVQYILMAKPHHPIFLDTVATIAELVESQKQLGALDLTGPGPFTDAVLRYLLVQYGVTPSDLRCLSSPVQVGDVLILQEEALLAPHTAMAKVVKARDWIWDLGYYSWRNGRQVAFHGLAGSWKGQGWN